MEDLELIEIGQFMEEFTLKGVRAETVFPQQTSITGYARHVGQPFLTEHNVLDWGVGLVFPKYLKSSALDDIDMLVCFSEMRKVTECFVKMSQQPVEG